MPNLGKIFKTKSNNKITPRRNNEHIQILCKDIQSVIVSFFSNISEILTWRHLCTYTMIRHSASFTCTKIYPMINTPNMNISKYFSDIRFAFLVIQLKCNAYTRSEFFNNQHDVETLICARYNTLNDSALKNIPKLKVLSCGNNVLFTDTGLRTLSNLTYLDCGSNNNFTDVAMRLLTKLTYLNIQFNNSITDESVKYLTNLQYLNPNDNITNNSLRCLTSLTELHESFNNVDMISRCKHLKKLTCDNMILSNSNIIHLTNLRILKAGPYSYFTDTLIKQLTKLTSLEYYVGITKITDESIKLLIDLKELTIVNLASYHKTFTDYGLSHLTNLQVLYLHGQNEFTDYGLLHLTNLRQLYCGNNKKFTDKSLMKLTKLTLLDCGDNRNFTDSGLMNLTQLNYLHCKLNDNFRFKYNTIKHIHYSQTPNTSLYFILSMVEHINKEPKKLTFSQRIRKYINDRIR